MSCEKIKPMLEAYLDGHLPPEEVLRVEDHLAVCADCQNEWEELQFLHDEVANLPPVRAPSGFKDTVMEKIAAGADKGARKETAGRIRPVRHLMPMSLAAAVIIMGITAYLVYLAQDYTMGPDAPVLDRKAAYLEEEERKAPSREVAPDYKRADKAVGNEAGIEREALKDLERLKKAPPASKRMEQDKQVALAGEVGIDERQVQPEDLEDRIQVLVEEEDLEVGQRPVEESKKVQRDAREWRLAEGGLDDEAAGVKAEEIADEIKEEFLFREDDGRRSDLVAYWVTGPEAWTIPLIEDALARGRVTAETAESASGPEGKPAISGRYKQGARESDDRDEPKLRRRGVGPTGPGVGGKGVQGGAAFGTPFVEAGEWEYVLLEVDERELENLLSKLISAKPDAVWKSTLNAIEAKKAEHTVETEDAYISRKPSFYAFAGFQTVWPDRNEETMNKKTEGTDLGFVSGRGRKAKESDYLESGGERPETPGEPVDGFRYRVLKISPYPEADMDGDEMNAPRDQSASMNKNRRVRKVLLIFPKGSVQNGKKEE